VAERRPASRLWRRDRRTEAFADIDETALAAVAIDDLALLVSGFGRDLPDFRIHVAVREEQIEPAVVVEIDERGAPPEPPRVQADAGREGAILAEPVAGVGIQRRRIAGEVRLEDVQGAVAIVVADRDAHAGLRLAVLAVGAARADGDVGERAVVIV